ncbi:beta-lactamase family protein [Streptomyces sp. ASQP_92]|uniref:serine hydrolase domain-containing protein n=1 Tax=Streptomyces sp. ASQP_92 TaxID=2979116 RepID=UPI0021C18B50|nr:serine hydrolase domain-containing protein [Streptomyces sp. ASQP_92]MCT9089057.1 beta-lactamase family protein [Streptomyces sp. ASQP_92]
MRTELARSAVTLATALALVAGTAADAMAGSTGRAGDRASAVNAFGPTVQQGRSGPVPSLPEVRAALTRVMGSGAPGAFAVVRDHDHPELGGSLAVGRADLDGTPMWAGARFRVGSNTKMFTSVLVLRLAEQGRLDLDKPLRDYLPPGTIPASWPITARQVLGHRAGVYDHVNDLLEQNGEETTAAFEARIRDTVYDPRALVSLSVRHGLQFPPGSAYAYTNTGFVLMGLAAEHLTGRPYAELLREQIFAPLGLRRTSFTVPAKRIVGRHVSGYLTHDDPREPLLDSTEQTGSWIWSAGGIVSSARDLDRFLTALLAGSAGGLISDDSLRQMTLALPTGVPHVAYGLGLRRILLSCGTVLGHGGIVQGFQSQAFATPDGRRTVVVFANASNNGAVTQGLMDALEPAFCGPASTRRDPSAGTRTPSIEGRGHIPFVPAVEDARM